MATDSSNVVDLEEVMDTQWIGGNSEPKPVQVENEELPSVDDSLEPTCVSKSERDDNSGYLMMNIQQYKQYIRTEIEKNKEKKRKELIDLFGQLGVKPESASKNVAAVLAGFPLEDIDILAKCGCEHDAKKNLYKNVEIMLHLKDLHILTIIAVSGNNTQKGHVVQHDTDRRLEDMDSFVRLLRDDKFNLCNYAKTVKNKTELDGALKTFFEDGEQGIKATGAYTAIVLFVGHGSMNGFQLLDGSAVPLDELIDRTQTLWEKAEEADHLPVVCEIIFSQCYGHLYDDSKLCTLECQRIRVRHFTDCTNYSTVSGIDPATGKRENHDLMNGTRLRLLPTHREETNLRLDAQLPQVQLLDVEAAMDSGVVDL